MVDKTVQQKRRQQLVHKATPEISGGFFGALIGGFILVGLVFGTILHVIRWFYVSTTSSPAQAHQIPYSSSFFIMGGIAVGIMLVVHVLEHTSRVAAANAEADKLDAEDVAAEERARVEAQRRAEAELVAKREQEEAARRHAQWMAEHARQEAAEARARRLAELVQGVLNGWARFQIDSDFLGQKSDDDLKRAYVSYIQKSLSGADWALLCESEDPRLRAIFPSGSRLR